jgi:hypothetical protein
MINAISRWVAFLSQRSGGGRTTARIRPRAASGVAGGAFCRGAASTRRPLDAFRASLAAALGARRTCRVFHRPRRQRVRDANGQALANVYFEEEPGRRGAAKLLTRDEAGIAANIAKLPDPRFVVARQSLASTAMQPAQKTAR